jgi:signal transduction histidine kinase
MAIYLAFAAVVARTLTLEEIRPLLTRYLGLEMLYVVLFTALFLAPKLPGWLLHLYFVLQSALVLLILSLRPEFDFVVVLFVLLSYQASLFFIGRMRWIWVGGFVLLTAGSLIFYLGFLRGLALALTTMAAEIVIPAYLMVNEEAETARAKSQVMLGELEDSRQQLQLSADRAEELAAMQERNRLARELHDTVSQYLFSISLTTRSAQMLLKKDPARVPEQLVRLQEMTGNALSQLRALISQMRPPQKS